MGFGGACKAVVLPLVSVAELTDSSVHKDTDHLEQSGGGKAKYVLAYGVHLIMVVAAGYLAWTCNMGETPLMRIVYTLLAVIFSGLYLVYYFVYRILMGNPCIVGAVPAAVIV